MLNISGTADPWLRLVPRRELENSGGNWGHSGFWSEWQLHRSIYLMNWIHILSLCLFCVCRRLKRKTIRTECSWSVTSGLNSSFRGQKPAVVPILSAATVFWSLNKVVFAERCWLDFALSWILLSFGDKERFNNWCGRASRSTGVCAE